MKKNNKGFTLMEMLIVVAIIAILIAIMIPTFTAQLEKAREATDAANLRSAYAEAMVESLTSDKGTGEATVPAMVQTTAGWKYVDLPDYLMNASKSGSSNLLDTAKVGVQFYVHVAADGTVTIDTTAPTAG